jgi:nucleoside-diphosphate kinase
MERTVVLLKPDAVHRNLIGQITARIEARNFKVVAMKMMSISKATLDDHYGHLTSKPFYPEIVAYMTSGPIIAMIVEGDGVVAGLRQLCGATNPAESPMGTIRADLANNIRYNLIHASDSVESATAEITRFFKTEEICGYDKIVIV